ncbi:hypothetical protein GOP47_0014664 [Adiantum capillus-veneris]|uniref:BHLH domain-containing protein n=1 Tax=Adiantum capillus-veneris TaxID=13818 RepID=A0A9D4UMN6_ADICA|nr:hypothetical protein GOP47_0014664 [Adiantum capillus-veneris]
MPFTNKSASKPGNLSSPSAGFYEEELLTWLQYPTDDALDRSYFSDVYQGGWSALAPAAPEVTVKSNLEVDSQGEKDLPAGVGVSTCEPRSMPHASHLGKHMETTMISRSSSDVNAEEALAQGAARAAGISSGMSKGVYNNVKTLMQPGTPYHAIDACSKEFKGQPIKPALPVTSVPASVPKPLQNARNMKPNHAFESSPFIRTKHTLSESATSSSSKRARTEYDTHSHTHYTDSSRITEEGIGIIEQDKTVARADPRCAKTSTSCSGVSHSSMSLSGRESLYSGKFPHKQDDLELLNEDYADAEDDSMDTRKRCKLPSKRNRVAEVHNLSERNRRNRINEKIKALQDLIPNSSKTDKASVLDEAIEYMKTLQMQLQMVSMRNSLNASPMMMPMNLPQPLMHMAQPHSIGLGVPIGHAAGMGMGLGLGIAEMGPSTNTTVLQYPAGMSQLHGMPFYGGNMAGFAHMGFAQNRQIPPTRLNVQEPCELSAQRPIMYMQHQQYEQERTLLRQPSNPESDALSTEQDDSSQNKFDCSEMDESKI